MEICTCMDKLLLSSLLKRRQSHLHGPGKKPRFKACTEWEHDVPFCSLYMNPGCVQGELKLHLSAKYCYKICFFAADKQQHCAGEEAVGRKHYS